MPAFRPHRLYFIISARDTIFRGGDKTLHFYETCGLTVASEVALPGMNPAPAGAFASDLTIRPGPVPTSLPDATAAGPTWQIAGEHFLLRVPGVARFLLSGGHAVTFEAEPDADPADIPAFVTGTVIGILLHQRGQIVLHASAVAVNGKAILFCGRSGAGKSTLAAALAQRGLPLVTDDLCAISIGADGVPTVAPDGRQLKLWAQSIDNLDLGDMRGPRVRGRLEKFYVEPSDAFDRALPLAAIYALREARPPHSPGIEVPNAVDAALVLRRNAYRPQLIKRMNQHAAYFHAATAIANTGGIFLLTRTLTFAAMPAVIAQLEQHWRDTGLYDRAA
jgi:hypothetical protein